MWSKCNERVRCSEVWSKCNERVRCSEIWSKCNERVRCSEVWSTCNEGDDVNRVQNVFSSPAKGMANAHDSDSHVRAPTQTHPPISCSAGQGIGRI